MSGNTNPFDPAHIVTTGANFDATMALVGYARTFSLFDRAAMVAIIVPMGRISGEVTAAGQTFSQSASGFGDPMLEFDINVLGPPAQKNMADVLRYEPGFSLDLIADVAVPIGEYDSDQPLNIGQNRWYGRVGAPIVWQLGPWVPGRRTTLEFLPAVWFFGDQRRLRGAHARDRSDVPAGRTSDARLHREPLGVARQRLVHGGEATIDGVEGEKLNNLGVGFTLGYQINGNLGLTFGYKSTVNDSAPADLRMDGFMVSLVSGWHPIIEGSRRLEGAK